MSHRGAGNTAPKIQLRQLATGAWRGGCSFDKGETMRAELQFSDPIDLDGVDSELQVRVTVGDDHLIRLHLNVTGSDPLLCHALTEHQVTQLMTLFRWALTIHREDT
jgi:hypothetical protein